MSTDDSTDDSTGAASARRRARRRTTADVATAVHRLGGTCTWRELRRAVSWRLIARATEEGVVRHPGRGVYTLAGAHDGRVVARRLTGVASHRTAALHWGWKVKCSPPLPDVAIPANRKLRASAEGLSTLHRRNLDPSDVSGGWVTTPVRTVIDCCLDLPFDEALSVFDSALRSGLPRQVVVSATARLGPRHRARVLAVERHATAKAANPFESVLRAIALGVDGTCWEPQHRIRYDDFYARVDLADEALGIVLEADSFEFHGERAALGRDCERYDELVARGWLVLRFSWEQVMLRPEWVARVIERTVRRRVAEGRGRSQGDESGRMTDLRPRAVVA
jgi:very-short-patch-repair endonuclease